MVHGSVDEFFLSGKQISFGWAVMDQIPAAMDRHLDVIQCHTGLSKMLFKLSHNDTTDTNKTRHLPVLSFFINFWFSTNKESFKCQFISLSCTIQLLCRYLVHTWLLLIKWNFKTRTTSTITVSGWGYYSFWGKISTMTVLSGISQCHDFLIIKKLWLYKNELKWALLELKWGLLAIGG